MGSGLGGMGFGLREVLGPRFVLSLCPLWSTRRHGVPCRLCGISSSEVRVSETNSVRSFGFSCSEFRHQDCFSCSGGSCL